MEEININENLLAFTQKMGYVVSKEMIQNIEIHYHKTFDFLPELSVFIASYRIKKSFTRKITPPQKIKNSIRFFFHNVFEYDGSTLVPSKHQTQAPYVRIFPSSNTYENQFKKNTQVNVISLFIEADYLQSFLGNDAEHFQYLFENGNNYLIEEMMSDDILRTTYDLIKANKDGTLKSFYYKLKSLELLYFLFQSLRKREKIIPQKLLQSEITVMYKLRDKITASFEKCPSIEELKQLAGMNENKARKLFTQIFGMGFYDYFQHHRILEAARLLREERLSVSEVGYQLGFENLSHFSRIFEKQMGIKPKKYAMLSL